MLLASVFENHPSSKHFLPTVQKYRKEISRGKLEFRAKLIEQLGELAMSYGIEGQFDTVLQICDEIIEMTETMIEEGNLRIIHTTWDALSQMTEAVHFGKIKRRKNSLNEEPFFRRIEKITSFFPEDQFFLIKNDWAYEIYHWAEKLHANGATISAIAQLDHSLKKIEPYYDPETTRFGDLKPYLDIYRTRGAWKCEIGDQASGMEDLLKYLPIAQLANAIIENNINATKKMADDHINSKGQIPLEFKPAMMSDFIAAFHYREEQYNVHLSLAEIYAARAEKELALQYYDQALAVIDTDPNNFRNGSFAYFIGPMDVYYRKGMLLAQYKLYEEAFEQFEKALGRENDLLYEEFQQGEPGQKRTETPKEKKARLQELKKFKNLVLQSRANVLSHLGRLDEAEETLDTVQKHLEKDTQERRLKLLQDNSGVEPECEDSKTGDSLTKNILQHFINHNTEGELEVQRGQIEAKANHWRKALRHFLKARYIMDTPLLADVTNSHESLLYVYSYIATSYRNLKEFEKADLWHERSIKIIQEIAEKKSSLADQWMVSIKDSRGKLCKAWEKYARAGDYYIQAFNDRNQLILNAESELEGYDRERLRVQDNQKLMPLALLYKSQVATIRAIQEILFAQKNRLDAELWANREKSCFEQFRALLLNPDEAGKDYTKTIASCAALLKWSGKTELCNEWLEQWMNDTGRKFDSEDDARTYMDISIAVRLKDCYALDFFQEGARLFNRMAAQIARSDWTHAYVTACVFRPFLVHEQDQLDQKSDEFFELKNEFYRRIIELVDNEIEQIIHNLRSGRDIDEIKRFTFDPDRLEDLHAIIAQEEAALAEEDIPPEDKDADRYENDVEDPKGGAHMLYKMLDKMTGNNIADEVVQKMEDKNWDWTAIFAGDDEEEEEKEE